MTKEIEITLTDKWMIIKDGQAIESRPISPLVELWMQGFKKAMFEVNDKHNKYQIVRRLK